MKSVLRQGRCAAVFALLLLGFILPAFGEEDPDTFLSSVREQSGLQLEAVRFKATYTYSHYIVDTFEEAERFDAILKARIQSLGRVVGRGPGNSLQYTN